MSFDASLEFAHAADEQDELRELKSEFLFPKSATGAPVVYLAGNSLGLQPRGARQNVLETLDDWERFGVEGHFEARHPWLPYHEFLTESTARMAGALPHEVVVMNTLTVNLHLMMVSFYRPTSDRFRILVEGGAFPSDRYAVASQARFHGFDPHHAVLELHPRHGESTLRTEDIVARIEREGEGIALVLLGSVNYLTGQAFDVEAITRAAHSRGCRVGFDLAHGAGNLMLKLHDWGPDFAVWCNYKYLNAGPGGLGGCFVHERQLGDRELPRFEGWWGHDKKTRFKMGSVFEPIAGAEAWQLSNPPILQLAVLRASMALFDRAGMGRLRAKSEKLTAYMETLLRATLPQGIYEIITPTDVSARGAQLSLRFHLPAGKPRELVKALAQAGVVCDFREPDIIRAAPAPLYCSFQDVHRFVAVIRQALAGAGHG